MSSLVRELAECARDLRTVRLLAPGLGFLTGRIRRVDTDHIEFEQIPTLDETDRVDAIIMIPIYHLSTVVRYEHNQPIRRKHARRTMGNS